MCPDRELNRQPFGSQAGIQSTELHQPGHPVLLYLCIRAFIGICKMSKSQLLSSDLNFAQSSEYWSITLVRNFAPLLCACKMLLQVGGHSGLASLLMCVVCPIAFSLALSMPHTACFSGPCSIWWEGYLLNAISTEQGSSTVQKQEQSYTAWVT